jgi:hypothetical protein
LGCPVGNEAAGASSCQLTELKSEWRDSSNPTSAFMSCTGTNFPLYLALTLPLPLPSALRFEKNQQVFKQEVNMNIRAVLLSLLQPTFLHQALLSLSTNVTRFMEN